MIDAWASVNSFKPKDGAPPKDGDDGTGMVDFKDEKRSIATHQSTTDSESHLMRKGKDQPARLSYGGHVLMENRNGLRIDILITESTQDEHRAARHLLKCLRRRHTHPRALGTGKGDHVKEFVGHLREHEMRPHMARIKDRKTPGLDGRTSRTESYLVSQRKRTRVEEIFGLLKTVGGLRTARFISQAKTQMAAFISGAAYNLLRIA